MVRVGLEEAFREETVILDCLFQNALLVLIQYAFRVELDAIERSLMAWTTTTVPNSVFEALWHQTETNNANAWMCTIINIAAEVRKRRHRLRV